MLQNIRENAQGTIAKTIIVLLILSLSVWGLDSIVGGSGEASVATVNGEEITEREFERGVRIGRQQRLQEMDSPDSSRIDMDQLNEEVLDQLIREKLIEQDIRERGLELTDQDIDQMITQAEQFQVDGSFSQQRFTTAVRNQGMTVEAFREMIERDHLTRVLQAVIQGSAFSTGDESERIARLLTQTRDFEVLEVPLSAVMDEITVSDGEIESFYADNKALFRQEESADVAWITLDQDDLVDPASIDEEAVRARYRERIEEMGQAEKRNPAHILIADDDAEKVDKVQKALDDGQDFGELAREYSDDTGSAEKGGELGLSSRDEFAEPFSEALFGLEEEGDVSGPVETSFGTHFIKLLDVETEEPPTFSDLESELRQELAQERAGKRFVELSDELADIAYSEYDLEAPSELIDAEIQTRDGVTPETEEAPFDHPELRRQLFSEDVREGGFNTELVEVAEGQAVVARVREYHPEKQKELEAVRDQVRALVKERKARDLLEQRLAEGADSDSIAGELGAEWQSYEGVDRRNLEAPAIVRDAAFGMPRPADSGVSTEIVELPEGMALIRLQGVSASQEGAAQMMASRVRSQLAQRHGQSAYFYYLEQLRSEAEIERD